MKIRTFVAAMAAIFAGSALGHAAAPASSEDLAASFASQQQKIEAVRNCNTEARAMTADFVAHGMRPFLAELVYDGKNTHKNESLFLRLQCSESGLSGDITLQSDNESVSRSLIKFDSKKELMKKTGNLEQIYRLISVF